MKRSTFVLVLTVLAFVTASAADAPYFGKWKVNSSKSQMTNMLTIEKLPSGDLRFEESGLAYTFKIDGKEYPVPDGSTVMWKAAGDNTWDVTVRANGKVAAMAKLKVDGNMMSATQTIPQAGGQDISQSSTLKRVSDGTGPVGKWQAVKTDAGAAWIEITPDGADGLKLAAPNSLCVAKFDDKPYPMSGATDGSKQTMSFRKKGSASFEALTYLDGKPFFKDVYVVSADGKVMTDTGTPMGGDKKPVKVVLERQ